MSAIDLGGPNPTPMTKREIRALQEVCEQLPTPSAIVQIGAGSGLSTLAMVEVLPAYHIFSIDIGERPEEFHLLHNAGIPDPFVIRLLGKSQDIGRHWPAVYGIDFLFVDGDHRYEGVKADIEEWVRHLKSGGIIAFHDYIPPSDLEQWGQKSRVYDAVEEWAEEDKDQIEEMILWVDRLIAFKMC